MKVHKGEYKSDGRPVRWIESSRKRELKIEDLIDGLCSHYIRNRVDDEPEPLPDTLTLSSILRTVHTEFDYYGTNAVWTWSDGRLSDEEAFAAREWARGLILAVLPELEIPSGAGQAGS